MDRPSWDNHMLSLALLVAQRSPDEQTKCGCIISNQKHQVLSQGFNGFPRGVDDENLPKIRPLKYDWMIHAEMNAIFNCSKNPDGGIAYITTEPCHQCLMSLWQVGIKNIVYATNTKKPHMNNQTTSSNRKSLEKMSGGSLVIRGVELDLSHLNKTFKKI